MNHNVKKLMSSIDFDSINLDDPSVFLLSEEQGGGTPNCLCHPVPPGTMTMLSADQTECWTSVGNYLGDACPPDPLTGSWGSHCPPWGVNACPYLWACSNTMCIYLPDACDCNYPTGPLGGPFCIMCMFSDTGVCDGIPCPSGQCCAPADDGGGGGCNGETTHGGCFSSREDAQGVSHPVCKAHSDAATCSVLGGVHRIGYNCGQCDDYGNNCNCCAGITCPPSCTGGASFSSFSQCYNNVDGSGGPAENTNICCNPTTGYCDPDFGFVESSCGPHSYCNTNGNACTQPCTEPGCYCSMWYEVEQEMCQNNLLPSNNTSCTSISDCDYWQDIYGNCYDPKEWTGSSCHMTCDVFDAVGCSMYGSLVGANGYTANEMCCACGGGNNPVDGTIETGYWWEGYFDCDINAENALLGYRNEDYSWNYHCAARGGFETWIEDDWPYQQGDGTCDRGGGAISPNLDCEEFNYDDGDCDCPPGQTVTFADSPYITGQYILDSGAPCPGGCLYGMSSWCNPQSDGSTIGPNVTALGAANNNSWANEDMTNTLNTFCAGIGGGSAYQSHTEIVIPADAGSGTGGAIGSVWSENDAAFPGMIQCYAAYTDIRAITSISCVCPPAVTAMAIDKPNIPYKPFTKVHGHFKKNKRR